MKEFIEILSTTIAVNALPGIMRVAITNQAAG